MLNIFKEIFNDYVILDSFNPSNWQRIKIRKEYWEDKDKKDDVREV